MKSSSAHRSSFLHRWLSRTSNATTNHDNHKDVDSEPTDPFSPPPLTNSYSTTAPSSIILTPRTSIGNVAPPVKSRVSGFQPRTPPTRYATLPVVTTSQAVCPPLKQQPAPPTLTVVPTEIKLHRLLSHDPMRRALNFDISLPSTFILKYPQYASSSAIVVQKQLLQPRANAPPQPMTDDDLSPLATFPPVTRMRIITDILPWSITVRGRSRGQDDPESFVRIIDVLDGIYKSLREGVSSDEWNRMPKPFRDQVKRAYARRCQASLPFTLKGYEERQGIRRVDYLKDKTIFMGLAMQVPNEGDIDSFQSIRERTWIIKLASRPS